MDYQLHNQGNPNVDIEGTIPQIELASTNQRLGNFFLDLTFLSVFNVIFVIVLAVIGLADFLEETNSNLLSVIIMLIYFVSQEALDGRTLGKRITGTIAVNEDGSELTFDKAFARTLCRLIPFEAFSFLGGQGRPKGWHDRIPNTKVISTRKKYIERICSSCSATNPATNRFCTNCGAALKQ